MTEQQPLCTSSATSARIIGFLVYRQTVSTVLAYKPVTTTTDTATAELLALTVGTSLDAATVKTVADAIDAGRFARSAATPDHQPTALALPAEVMSRMAGMFELVRRASAAPPPTAIRSSADVVAIAARELGGRDRESVLVIVCDAANSVIKTQIVSRGAVDRALFPVREILVATLQADGRAFAVAHNHVTPVLEPSEADTASAALMAAAARNVGLRFLGHSLVTPRPVPTGHAEPNTRFMAAGSNAFAA